MQRIALGVEYDGSRYFGWQRQTHRSSIQEKIEEALGKIACERVTVFCAGRTDAGVHATGQVIHFDTSTIRQENAWIHGVNAYLPQDIRILWCRPTPTDFDARKSAILREYCYIIANRRVRPGIFQSKMSWVYGNLDIEGMQQGANFLLGNHDFTSFRGAHCQAKSPVRSLHSIKVTKMADRILFNVVANAFLYHMVRNIVGTLLLVGKSKYPPEWVQEVLEKKDRREAGMTVSPDGLYLVKVEYPNHFNIPTENNCPW